MVSNLLEEVELDKITREPEKYRHFDLDEEGVEKLALDIKEKGLLVPVLLWRKGDKNYLISGYHRYECAKRLQWKRVAFLVMHMRPRL